MMQKAQPLSLTPKTTRISNSNLLLSQSSEEANGLRREEGHWKMLDFEGHGFPVQNLRKATALSAGGEMDIHTPFSESLQAIRSIIGSLSP